MWTQDDSTALQLVFNYAWQCFNTEFQVLGFTTTWWQIMLSCFGIFLVFKLARGIFEI